VIKLAKVESPVKELRNKIGVSQRELADALGVHHTLVANIEANIVSVDEEDDETKAKVTKIFEKLAEYSGIPKGELLKQQAQCTKQAQEAVYESIKNQIFLAAEELVEAQNLSHEGEFEMFVDKLEGLCESNCKSPLYVIRSQTGITQRQLAQAAGVSQTVVARIELGELGFEGLNTGFKVFELIAEGLGLPDIDHPHHEPLYEALNRCQKIFKECNSKRAKDKVESAFKKLKVNSGGKNKNSEAPEILEEKETKKKVLNQ